jgi:hypothetical protein
MEIAPDLPMRGWSRSRIVSPVISHHLHMPLPAGCPVAGIFGQVAAFADLPSSRASASAASGNVCPSAGPIRAATGAECQAETSLRFRSTHGGRRGQRDHHHSPIREGSRCRRDGCGRTHGGQRSDRPRVPPRRARFGGARGGGRLPRRWPTATRRGASCSNSTARSFCSRG